MHALNRTLAGPERNGSRTNGRRFAGVGSRQTPRAMIEVMVAVAHALCETGWTLRSGGAGGADSAFEQGARSARGSLEIFLPQSEHNGRRANGTSVQVGDTPATRKLTARYHPAWHRVRGRAVGLHARNAAIVLGLELDSPVEAVIGWTVQGLGAGGTGQAYRIAEGMEIAVIDLERMRYGKPPNAVDHPELRAIVETQMARVLR